MKRKQLLRELAALGCVPDGEGKEHTLLRTRDGLKIAVPRHKEISEGLTRDLLKKARGAPTPT